MLQFAVLLSDCKVGAPFKTWSALLLAVAAVITIINPSRMLSLLQTHVFTALQM